MRGNITRRGKSSWRIKFDCGTGEDGQRKYHVETVKGTKADAQALLAKRLNEFAEGRHVNRSGGNSRKLRNALARKHRPE